MLATLIRLYEFLKSSRLLSLEQSRGPTAKKPRAHAQSHFGVVLSAFNTTATPNPKKRNAEAISTLGLQPGMHI